MILPDQVARDKFINDINHNFSVLAPAGVGKTTAIANRVINILKTNRVGDSDELVVVTYTEKAANELKQKTINLAKKLTVSNSQYDVSNKIDSVFFGTIHSFATKLIKEFGNNVGFKQNFMICDDNQTLWNEFLSNNVEIWNVLEQSNIDVNITEISKYTFIKSTHKDETKPELILLNKFFAEKFFEYKKNISKFTYDDLIIAANEIVNDVSVNQLILNRKMSVILDEAQDTDVEQFKLLLTVAGNSKDINLANYNGRFSMVGDPQQSIYMSRASVDYYVRLHNSLVACGAIDELTFDTTMRCQKSIVQFVNKTFQPVFYSNSSDIKFVDLKNHSEASAGKVSIIELANVDKSIAEADLLAEYFRDKTLSDFEINKWSDIAVLAPRNGQLELLYDTFTRKTSIKTQLHNNDLQKNNPFIICLISLLKIFLLKGEIAELLAFCRKFLQLNLEDINYISQGYYSSVTNSDFQVLINEVLNQKNVTLRDKIEKILLFIKFSNFGDKFCNQQTLCVETILTVILKAVGEKFQYVVTHVELFNWLKDNVYNMIYGACEEPDAIQLLSFHKSKGLEWPVVVLPFLKEARKEMLSQKNVFGDKVLASKKWKENEQRMLYVASTRAKKHLIMTSCQQEKRKMNANMHTSFSLLWKNF